MIRLSGVSLAVVVLTCAAMGIMVGTAAQTADEAKIELDANAGVMVVGDEVTPMPEVREMQSAEHPIRDVPGNVIDWDPYVARSSMLSSLFTLTSTLSTAMAQFVFHAPIPDSVWLSALRYAPVGMIGYVAYRFKPLVREVRH